MYIYWKTFRKFQREDALACGNNWKEMVVDAIGKSNVWGKETQSCDNFLCGKLFFYKIEEVLVTSAGQCAGARVNHGACSLMSRDQQWCRQTWKLLKIYFAKTSRQRQVKLWDATNEKRKANLIFPFISHTWKFPETFVPIWFAEVCSRVQGLKAVIGQ